MVVATCLLTGCKSAKVSGQHDFAPVGVGKPTVIYVADFELAAASIQHEEGLLSETRGRSGRVSKLLSGEPRDPQAYAHKLVTLMADSIVKDLANTGLMARRLVPGRPLPADGWLVRGVFTEVQEGNRLRRTMVGLGEGQTDLQVVTVVENLSEGAPKPLYELNTEASSGKTLGTAPTLVLGPYGAAARFVMSGKDIEKNIKQTAAQIAAQVNKHVAGVK